MALPYTTLQTAVLPDVQRLAWDTIYNGDAFVARLRKNAIVKAVKWYDQPIRHALPNIGGASGWYSGYTTYTLSRSDTLTKARYTRKQLREPYLVTDEDEWDSQSAAAILSIVTERSKGAVLQVKTKLASAIFGSATASAVEGNAVVGLQDIVSTSDPVTWYVGGIQRADLTAWSANVYTKSTSGYGDGSLIKLTPHKLRKAIADCERGEAEPGRSNTVTMIVTTKAIFQVFLQWASNVHQIVTYAGKAAGRDGLTANYGFVETTFQGIPVMWSPNCTAGYCYLLNEDYYGMLVHPGVDVSVSGPIQVPDSTGKAGFITWAGLMWCTDPSRLAVMQDIDVDA